MAVAVNTGSGWAWTYNVPTEVITNRRINNSAKTDVVPRTAMVPVRIMLGDIVLSKMEIATTRWSGNTTGAYHIFTSHRTGEETCSIVPAAAKIYVGSH